MKIVDPNEMKNIDSISISQYGIPGIILMENAALRVVEVAHNMLKEINGHNVLIVAGKGNNGGDALAVARHLINNGIHTTIYCVADVNEIMGDAKQNFEILSNMGFHIKSIIDKKDIIAFENVVQSCDLLIDGILGTGLKGNVSGLIYEVIDIINKNNKNVLSIDIPSGINGCTGEICGISIKATKTVTFALPKTGLLIHPGCEFVGELIVGEISIPKDLLDGFNCNKELIEGKHIKDLLPKRKGNSNKGTYGRASIITGSPSMTGAGCLAAQASYKCGTGIVYLHVPKMIANIYRTKLTEPIVVGYDDNEQGCLCKDKRIIEDINTKNVCLIGPGLSVNYCTKELVEDVILHSSIPLVIDADALNCICDNVKILKSKTSDTVITPHPGEMARLTGSSVSDVQSNRIEIASSFAKEYNTVVALKGSRTIVATPQGKIFINPTGNAGLAKAGTGDVLAGMICGFVAQGVTVLNATLISVYLHGLAADIAIQEKGKISLIASDVVDSIPLAIKKILGE